MVRSGYHYVLEILRKDATPIGRAVVEIDWGAAEEWARFLALRCGRLSAAGACGVTSVEPVWHPTLGAPYVKAFRLSITGAEHDAVASDLATAYLQGLAQKATAHFVENGTLQAGERILYLTMAFASREQPPAADSMAFTTEEVAPSMVLSEASVAELSSDAVLVGEPDREDVPVFVPQAVLEEAAHLARQADAVETGGILIGHLHRDSTVGDVFVRVTAQLPARHTEATATRLTFTAETWSDVRAALALRRRGEIMLGWWHSHPVRHWCKDCPAERQRVCHLGHDFFSEHDRALHRAVFSRGYSIALVVNDCADEPSFSLFGWRRGLVEPRGFASVGARGPAVASERTQQRLEGEPCYRRERECSILATSSGT